MKEFNYILYYIIGLLLLCFSNQLLSVQYPILPDQPQEPVVENTKNPGSQNKKLLKSSKTREQCLQYVTISLGSQDEIHGKVSFPKEISFSHYKNGLLYHNKVSCKQLASIKIMQLRYIKLNTIKNMTQYEFRPELYKVSLKNKKTYLTRDTLKFLLTLQVNTSDGKVTLFSFFSDTFSKKNGWTEVHSKDLSYHEKHVHPQSIAKIDFSK